MLQVISKLLANALLQDTCKQSGDLLFSCLCQERVVVVCYPSLYSCSIIL